MEGNRLDLKAFFVRKTDVLEGLTKHEENTCETEDSLPIGSWLQRGVRRTSHGEHNAW